MIQRLSVDELKEGLVLAEAVSTPFGAVVADAGLTLDKKLIARIKANRIHEVKVIAGGDEAGKAEDYLKEIAQHMRNVRNQVIFKTSEEVEPVIEDIARTIREAPYALEYVELLMKLHTYSEAVFAHSSNVAIICRMFADWHGLKLEQARELATAAFIHDIGKLSLPLSILDAARPLTEAEFAKVKKHSVDGYMMLKNTDIPENIKRAVLDHHERCDGSGYPMGYTFSQISEYGRMIGIADSYEAMTAKRSYRDKICPFKIGSIMIKDMEGKYDSLMLEEFFSNILNPYIGSKVVLSNGYTAKLKGINRQNISLPVIELAGRTIDLSVQGQGKIQVVGIA